MEGDAVLVREAGTESAVIAEQSRDLSTVLSAYLVVLKPRIMSLLLFTTLAALLIAAREHPVPVWTFWKALVGAMLGGAMAAGGAAALNCYIDRDIDVIMGRTRRRPIPAGTLTPRQVLTFGLTLSALSLVVLLALTTPVATLLALIGNLFYVVIYTMWLKRSTTQNIVIGGIAGAIPPLVGWAAITNGLALPAVLLCVIITYWTPAHFWSLALLVHGDYSRAQVPMLPSVTTRAHARWQIVVYAILTVTASLMLFSIHAMGLIYLVAGLVLGAGFIALTLLLYRGGTARLARRTFLYSNFYLAALFAAMIVDRLVS